MSFSRFGIVLGALLWAASGTAWAHADLTGYSGAPGRGTCAGTCHGSSSGTIVSSGFPLLYAPDSTYLITLRKLSGNSIRNFNASCRIGTGTQNAGVLSAGTGTATYNISGETNGLHLSSNNRDSATFLWTAPAAGTGPVRLYVAGLQGSYSGLNTVIVSMSDEAAAPGVATTPYPADGSANIARNVVLNWAAGLGAESHDVYFGANVNPPFAGNVSDPLFDPEDTFFVAGTTYYWRVDERNAAGVRAGPLWHFSVWALPQPGTNPEPANGAADVPLAAHIIWTAGAHTLTHGLEFGLTDPPPIVWSSVMGEPEYAPEGGLLPDRVYFWRVTEHNPFGEAAGPMWSFRTAAVNAGGERGVAIPVEMTLGPTYPNPFNATLTISFALPKEQEASLTLYNILGQPVAELARGSFAAGTHRFQWSSESVGTGIYFLRLQSGAQTRTAKVVALK